MREKAVRWTNWIREQELETLDPCLKHLAERSARLLEIGGGNGLQAKLLANMGFQVVSIDPAPRRPSHFPVQAGDCTRIEFDDDSFDVVFSSNVLEHVVDLSKGLIEMKRVLKPGGIMIHTMPTPTSTVLTMLVQPIGYIFGLCFVAKEGWNFFRSCLLKLLWKSKSQKRSLQGISSKNEKSLDKENIYATLKMLNPLRLIITQPHGSSVCGFAELCTWRKKVWQGRFAKSGLTVKQVLDLPLAYSRHNIFPFHFIGLRRSLAKIFDSSCAAYILTVEEEEQHDDGDGTF